MLIRVIDTPYGRRFSWKYPSEYSDDDEEELTAKTLWAPRISCFEEISVNRRGNIIAKGNIYEVGTHGSFPAFVGLALLLPVEYPILIRASEFENGDQIVIQPAHKNEEVSPFFDKTYWTHMTLLSHAAQRPLYKELVEA